MISKNSLVILNMLLDMLIQDYDYKVDELLNDEQKEKITEAIDKYIGNTTCEEEKEIFKKMFDKYLKKL